MIFKFIGRGGAFAPMSIGNSNILFEENGKFMMFDFGQTAPYILRDEMGFDLGDIDALYLTHEHADHVGGVEQLAFSRYFIPNRSGKPVRPKLFIHSELVQSLWNNTLRGGLDGHHGKTMGLTDYFECIRVQKNKHFYWQGVKMIPFQTVHVNCGYTIKYSHSLFIENEKTGNNVMITGDTCFQPDQLAFLYNKATVIFHDCETSPYRSHVHPNIVDLRTLAPEIKAKTYLYHYGEKVDAPDFAGFVEKGQVFEF